MSNEKVNLAETLTIEEFKTANIVRGQYKFDYEIYEEPKLHTLRETYGLIKVVAGATSEFEKFVLLRDWLKTQWLHGNICQTIPPFDALVILERVAKGERYQCGSYGMAYVQCCLSVGLQARLLAIGKKGGASGHVVTEIWTDQFGKWAVMDPDYNIHYEKNGFPLNALELHNAWLEADCDSIQVVKGKIPDPGVEVPENKLLDYYYDFRIQLRNDHLSKPHDDDYHPMLHWIDEKTPPLLMFHNWIANAKNSGRAEDLYWTLNQVALDIHIHNDCYTAFNEIPVDFSFEKLFNLLNLSRRYKNLDEIPIHLDEERLKVLRVDLDTVTPDFDTFLVKIDDSDWQPKPASFIWTLHEGVNLLQAKVRNKFGLEGPISKVRILYRD